MKRSLLLFIFALAAVLSAQIPAAMSTPPTGWVHVRQIKVELPPNATTLQAANVFVGTVAIIQTDHGSGTGFWLDETHLATCFHVVENAQRIQVRIMDQDIGTIDPNDHSPKVSDSDEIANGRVIAADPIHDLAIVASDTNPFFRLPGHGSIMVGGISATPRLAIPSLHSGELADGEHVWLVGYPAGVQHAVIQHGTVSYLEKNVDGGRVASPAYVLDEISNPGNSGGPVFDSRGHVAGILRGAPKIGQQGDVGPRPAEGVSYAIPSRFLIDMVLNAKLRVQVAKDTATQKRRTPAVARR